jgi:hypothetical protein
MNYNQNKYSYKPSKLRSGLHIAACIIAGIVVASFLAGVASALIEML